jgi:molybdate transport system ATP-binding protein
MIKIEINKALNGAKGTLNLELNTSLKKGSFNAIYGPSGVGKTSILRMLAGLMKPDKGLIDVDGVVWFDGVKGINVKPQKRDVGIVFQDYGLFPQMTVEENIRFALRKNQDDVIIDELIEMMSLGSLSKQKPEFLSGGQKQRVALARTLVQKPKLLLLDEPLNALGIEMREELQEHIKNIHDMYGLTTILVSHDLDEVVKLSDFIIRIAEGGKVIAGRASDVFHAETEEADFGIKLKVIDVIIEDGERYYATVSVNGTLRKINCGKLRPGRGEFLNLSITAKDISIMK